MEVAGYIGHWRSLIPASLTPGLVESIKSRDLHQRLSRFPSPSTSTF
jgi:hypothetical protein